MTTSIPGKWLFANQNHLLRDYARADRFGDSRKLRVLKVQIFAVHENHLLLIQDHKTGTWTAPFKLIDYDEANPQTIWKSVLRVLKQLIEERKLVDIQFADLGVDIRHIVSQWSAEQQHNIGSLQLSIILTAAEARLDDRTKFIECSTKSREMKWFTMEEANGLKLGDLTAGRVTRVFGLLMQYAMTYDRLLEVSNADPVPPAAPYHMLNLVTNASQIRLGLQTVYCGFNITHAIMLSRKDEVNSPIFITEVTKKICDSIGEKQREVSVRVPLPGREWRMTMYVVIGKTIGGVMNVKPGLNLDLFKGIIGEGGRLKIEWMHWNREVRLEPEGEEKRVDELFT